MLCRGKTEEKFLLTCKAGTGLSDMIVTMTDERNYAAVHTEMGRLCFEEKEAF